MTQTSSNGKSLFILFAAISVLQNACDDSENEKKTEEAVSVYYGEAYDCGDGAQGETEAVLIRQPYLQSVDEKSAIVAWGTATDTTQGAVNFSSVPGLKETAVAESFDIEEEDISLRLFHARLENLTAGTWYCYSVYADGERATGSFGFYTAPESPRAPATGLKSNQLTFLKR